MTEWVSCRRWPPHATKHTHIHNIIPDTAPRARACVFGNTPLVELIGPTDATVALSPSSAQIEMVASQLQLLSRAECEENKWEFCIQGKNDEPSTATASILPLLFLFYISNRLPDGWTQCSETETAPNFQAQQVIVVRPLHCDRGSY